MTTQHKNGISNGSLIPIGVVITIIMVLLETISYVAWTVTNANIDRIEKQATARTQTIEKEFLRIREHEEYVRRLDSQIAKMETRIGDSATRSEVDGRLGVNHNSIIQVRTELDALKRDLGQTYSVKDALKDLQDQVKTLQNRPYVTPMNNDKPK